MIAGNGKVHGMHAVETTQAEYIWMREQVEKLEREADFYRSLVEGTDDLITRVDEQGRFTYVNHTAERIFGLPPAACIGQPAFDFIHPDDQEQTATAFATWIEQGLESVTFENRLQRSDGAICPILWTINLQYDEWGRVLAINSIGRDIRTWKALEDQLAAANAELAHLVAERTAALDASQAACQQSQTLLQRILDSLPQAVFWKDPSLAFMGCNRTFLQHAGLSSAAPLLGKTDFDMPWAGDAEQYRADDRAVLATGTPRYHTEEMLEQADGKPIWLRTSKVPLYDERGAPLALLGIFEDMTAIRDAEEELRVARFTLDQATDGVQWVGPDGRHLYVNEAVCRNLGYTQAELLSLNVRDIDPNVATEAAWHAAWQGIKQQGSLTFESVHRRKDGSTYPVEVSANYMTVNGQEYACAFTRDIGERKQREADMRRITAAVESSSDLIGIADATGQSVYQNRAMCDILGYTVEELNAAGGPSAIYTRLELLEEIAAALQQGESWTGEVELVSKDGRTIPMLLRSDQIFDDAGNVIGLIGVHTDITERKRQEEELQLFRAMAENAPDMVGIVRFDTAEFIYANPAHHRLLGYEAGELLGSHLTDVFGEDPDDLMALVQTCIEQGSWSGRIRYRRKDGSQMPCFLTGFVVRNAAGEPLAIAGLARDITEQLQAEERMQMLAAVLDNSSDFVGIASLDGRPMYLNGAGRAMVGLASDAPLPPVIEFFPPEDQAYVEQTMLPTLQEQGQWEGAYRFRHFETGAHIPIFYNFFLVRDRATGQPICLATVTRDLTEQQRAAEELRQSQMMLRGIFENAPAVIVVKDAAGRYIRANHQTHSLGLDPEQIIGKTDYDLFPSAIATRLAYEDRQVTAGRAPLEIEVALPGKDGERTFLVNKFPLFDERGTATATVVIATNITDRKRAEEEQAALQQQVINAQRDALRELSTPLIPLSDNIVLLPLIGSIDPLRARQVMETLLEGVASNRARVAILDITGVQMVDTQVANALIRSAQAARLLGAQVVLTGIQPRIAQTLVQLGVDLNGVITQSTLQRGIAYALSKTKPGK